MDFYNYTKKHGSAIFINKENIKKNFSLLEKEANPAIVAAVIKSNAYGLGLLPITQVLLQTNCTNIFVATLEEAMVVRKVNSNVNIYVLHGIFKDAQEAFLEHNLTPVLSSIEQLNLWKDMAKIKQAKLDCLIQLDTGMNRLGIKPYELKAYVEQYDNSFLEGLNVKYVMSHLACSGQEDHPANKEQLDCFILLTNKYFKNIKRSLSASYSIFFGKNYHFDMVRPGFALYGSNPTPKKTNPLLPVISCYSSILKINELSQSECVGYNYTWCANDKRRIATVSFGYSDGICNHYPTGSSLFINNERAPIIGRVSMDSLMLDITNLKTSTHEGDIVEIIGKNQDIDAFSALNNCINCEALNMLSLRYPRYYY